VPREIESTMNILLRLLADLIREVVQFGLKMVADLEWMKDLLPGVTCACPSVRSHRAASPVARARSQPKVQEAVPVPAAEVEAPTERLAGPVNAADWEAVAEDLFVFE
jgi:hypothetical protein